MPDPLIIIAAIFADLRAAIAACASRDRAQTALLVRAWTRVGRMGTRLAALFARWQAGTLPKPRAAPAGRPRSPQASDAPATPAAPPRLPSTYAWLVARVPGSSAFASQLLHLLARPELADFLRDVPAAGRILRPFCRILATELPPELVLPPRPRKPRPRTPRPDPPLSKPRTRAPRRAVPEVFDPSRFPPLRRSPHLPAVLGRAFSMDR